MFISKQQIRDQSDLPQIISTLEKGKIVFLDTQPLFAKHSDDVAILKKTIDNLRHVVIRRGGSLGRVGKSILVLSPRKNVKII